MTTMLATSGGRGWRQESGTIQLPRGAMSTPVTWEGGKYTRSEDPCPVQDKGRHSRLVGQGTPSLCPFPT